MSPVAVGQTVGNYRVLERLGEGGMGAVYRALDEMLDREVAIKVLRPELARQAALVERFRQEARALARLHHPRIATLLGLERQGDDLLMVMEFVRGDTLEAIVERSGRLAWPRAAELCVAVLDALDHAHDQQIVHRDVKPANVMLSSRGAVKVMDFGIARMLGRNRQTQAGHSVGTPAYMAPEQLRGEEVDRRTDLYAVGAMLFELVTGRVAFEAESDYRLMMMQLNEPPPPPSALAADVPASIDAVVARAMAKARDDRFPDAASFADALRAALADAPARATPAAVPLTRLQTPATERVVVERAVAERGDDAVAETRLADAGIVDAAPSVAVVAPHRDWRVWGAAGALLAAAGIAALALRGPSAPVDVARVAAVTDTARAADSATVAAPDAPPSPRGGDARSLIINPPAAEAPVAETPVAKTPVTSVAPSPPPRRRVEAPAPPVVEPPPAERAAEREEPRAPRGESDGEAREAITAALVDAAQRLSGRAADAAESVLDDAVRGAWGALMREGRVSLALDGAPAVQRDGDRATATFDATVNVRSPFGANRRRAARFSAELRRGGGGWTVRSLRPVGPLSLQ